MAEGKELKIELWGRVQGVNLRRQLMKRAQDLKLTGYVKNRADGSVLVVAQDGKSGLEELLLWCQGAVFPAKVSGMSYEWGKPKSKYKGFQIKKESRFIKDQAKSFVNLGKEVIRETKVSTVPQHIVIIPDGNRRWARAQGWKPWVGHKKAAAYERVKPIIEECKELGVKYLTLWVWSTENWDRSEEEKEAIFDLFRDLVSKLSEELARDKIRFRHLGRKDRIPRDIIRSLEDLEEKTKNYKALNLQVCMDYGGRDEILRAVNGMIHDGVEDATEEVLSKYLDTKSDVPDPDLIIRTSGEKRTSGIMPFQSTYAELYFTDVPFQVVELISM